MAVEFRLPVEYTLTMMKLWWLSLFLQWASWDKKPRAHHLLINLSIQI